MTTTEPAGRGMLRTLLLACGILSSVLYVTTDLLGGLTYEGYSFSAQTISELGDNGKRRSPSSPPALDRRASLLESVESRITRSDIVPVEAASNSGANLTSST